MRRNTYLAIGWVLLAFACRNESRGYSSERGVDAAVKGSNPRHGAGREAGSPSGGDSSSGDSNSAAHASASGSGAPADQHRDADSKRNAELDGGDADGNTPAQGNDGGQTPSPLCASGQEFCLGNTVRLCSVDGRSSEEQIACSDTQYCDTATASCTDGVCAPNLPTCYKGAPATCDNLGSAFVTTGAECTGSQTCSAGACVPHVCSPNEAFCQMGNVHVCTADGLAADLLDTCASGEYCDAGACVPDVCTAGAVGCGAGEQPQICNQEGSDWDDNGPACGGLTPHCLKGACVACTPEDTECTGSVPRVCSSDGSWVAQAACTNPKPVCDAATATCKYEDSKNVAGVVACGANGETVCDVTDGEFCCINRGSTGPAPPPLVNACASTCPANSHGMKAHRCDADNDCPSGKVCCYHETDGHYTSCENNCDSQPTYAKGSELCIPGETQCSGTRTCTPVLTAEFGIGACR